MDNNNSDNYLFQVLILVGLVIVGLISLYFVPESVYGKLGLKQIDILSDIRKDSVVEIDSVPIPVVEIPFIDSCRTGLTCFEDYSPKGNGMNAFFKAIDNRHKLKRPIRIAFFGDSYIEGDILTSALRCHLQDTYGGSGVGFVGITSLTANFRPTVKHKFGGWKSYSLVDTIRKNYTKMGISGQYFIPQSNAWVKYSGVKMPHLETMGKARILYSANQPINFVYKINNKEEQKALLRAGGDSILLFELKDSIEELQLKFNPDSDFHLFGVSLEGDEDGILVDNFSLRGTPGTNLVAIPEETLKSFDKLIPYDLIVFQYGLNVMSPKVMKYTRYQEDMTKVVEHFQKCFPNSSIMLLSVGDRSSKQGGEYATMPCVLSFVGYQRAICAETGIVFWDMFDGMGGSGSMVELVRGKPSKASKDYTHLNFEGGKYLGKILFETLMYEKEKYDKKQAHYKRN